jgi:adenylate cyclase
MQAQRILIVDDNETNRDILEARLTANGYEVLHAGDGEEALAAAKAHRPDLILLDVMMPKLDGIEVCRHLKRNPETHAIRILGVTGYPTAAPELLAAGADAVLTKPLALDEIEGCLGRLVD